MDLAFLGLFPLLIMFAILFFMIATFWIIFTKAGQPGWACLIPFFNLYTFIKVSGKPGWWFFLYLIPLVNIVIGIMVVIAVAENFGKGTGFAIGMFFLGIIFYPILAFGSAKYVNQTS